MKKRRMGKLGRMHVVPRAEREMIAAFLRGLLEEQDANAKPVWSLRALGTLLGFSPETIRKAKDPNGVGQQVVDAVRKQFDLDVMMTPKNGPLELIASTEQRLAEVGAESPRGLALYLALEGETKSHVPETWKQLIREALKVLEEDGVPKREAYEAIAGALTHDWKDITPLELYRRARAKSLKR